MIFMMMVMMMMMIIVIGATGTVSKPLRQNLSNTCIPGKHEIKGLQKAAIFGTGTNVRKVLM